VNSKGKGKGKGKGGRVRNLEEDPQQTWTDDDFYDPTSGEYAWNENDWGESDLWLDDTADDPWQTAPDPWAQSLQQQQIQHYSCGGGGGYGCGGGGSVAALQRSTPAWETTYNNDASPSPHPFSSHQTSSHQTSFLPPVTQSRPDGKQLAQLTPPGLEEDSWSFYTQSQGVAGNQQTPPTLNNFVLRALHLIDDHRLLAISTGGQILILLDSGATLSACPPNTFVGRLSDSRYRGQEFGTAADNASIKADKEMDAILHVRCVRGNMFSIQTNWQICNVAKPLLSVAELSLNGHTPIFHAQFPRVELASGDILPLRRIGKAFYLVVDRDSSGKHF
jgi:hypothetical protein